MKTEEPSINLRDIEAEYARLSGELNKERITQLTERGKSINEKLNRKFSSKILDTSEKLNLATFLITMAAVPYSCDGSDSHFIRVYFKLPEEVRKTLLKEFEEVPYGVGTGYPVLGNYIKEEVKIEVEAIHRIIGNPLGYHKRVFNGWRSHKKDPSHYEYFEPIISRVQGNKFFHESWKIRKETDLEKILQGLGESIMFSLITIDRELRKRDYISSFYTRM